MLHFIVSTETFIFSDLTHWLMTHDSWLIDSFDSLILYTPRHTNFCKILWLWGGVSPLVFDKSHSNVAILTNFKVLFWVVSTDFPELVHVESWKNYEKVYVTEHCSLSNRLTSHPSWLPPDWTDSPTVQYVLRGGFIFWIASIEKVLSCNV